MSDIQDMPNQRPSHIGAGLASLAQFFSETRVDAAKMHTMAAMLQKRGITGAQMQKIVSTAMDECERFPSLAWMLKTTNKRKKDSDGWHDRGPDMTDELSAQLLPHERRWIVERSDDLWAIRQALIGGNEPHRIMEKWRLYLDHNRYLRQAPHGDLVLTKFERRDQVQAEMQRVDYTIPEVRPEDIAGGGTNCAVFFEARERTYRDRLKSEPRPLFDFPEDGKCA